MATDPINTDPIIIIMIIMDPIATDLVIMKLVARKSTGQRPQVIKLLWSIIFTTYIGTHSPV